MTNVNNTAKAKALPRVEVPAWTDAWMRGDRYGRVVGNEGRILHVRLDKSGTILRVSRDDCTEVAR